MQSDVPSITSTVPTFFDFDTPSGILFVLRAIRASEISTVDKNNLKDLVFLYSVSGKNEQSKKKLIDTLTAHSVTPKVILLEVPKVSVTDNSKELKEPSLGGFVSGRSTPVFHPPVSDIAPTPNISIRPPHTPVTPSIKTVEVSSKTVPVDTSVKISPDFVQKITPVIPLEKPTVRVLDQVVSVAPEVSESNNIEVVKKNESQINTSGANAQEYVTARMARIRDIKADVNARVGNPVNLVDVDNSLGREYMSALLEAMKLLSSASEQESANAMSRLESVYTKVLDLLTIHQAPQATIVPSVPVVPMPTETLPDLGVVNVPQVSSHNDFGLTAQPEMQIEPSVPKMSATITRSKVSEKPTMVAPLGNWDVPATVDVVPSVGQVVVHNETPDRMSTPPAEPLIPITASSIPLYQPERTTAVVEEKPLRVITELPTADEVSAVESVNNDPLYTKDVDAGLDQLLGEWVIFKKSGLFGTGPKGREHPLYTKISQMQVPLILSGRFEGSTQEIKQSITDYMNGWRYEQGIIYTANETFDLYLRRVIRHILDLQKAKRRS